MKSIQHLVHCNVVHLKQGLDLLRDLTDADYVATQSPVYTSGVGEHLRHILEHYICFLEGIPNGQIDYDARRRDTRISSDRIFASTAIREISDGLENLNSENTQLDIKMAGTKEADDGSPWSESTVKRELQYLQAHTIHHYALIALILRIQGIAPHEEFGVAPSTLRHRLQRAEAAG